jgi:hypothetical protein
MNTIIASIPEINANWLTNALRRSGALPQGQVLSLTVQPHDHHLGHVSTNMAHLTLQYSAEAPATAPRHLFWKHYPNHDGAVEVSFYKIVANLPEPVPGVIPCYEAAYDPESGESHCLLDDLSATHRIPLPRDQVMAGEGVPSPQHLAQIMNSLARFHAYWWEHPLLGTVPDTLEVRWWYRDREHFDKHIVRRQNNWAAFLSQEAATLSPELHQLYEHALANLPRLWERYFAPRVSNFHYLTLANGDGYFNQYLCPTSNAADSAYLIDFQEISANFGASDLVYLLPMFWSREQRYEQSREEQALRLYHAALCAQGVTGYTWDDLMTDYRLMITLMIFLPVWDQTEGSSREYWWLKMRCLTAAYQDLECARLFDI